jgi:integrase
MKRLIFLYIYIWVIFWFFFFLSSFNIFKMINRNNWLMVRSYLEYRRDVDLLGASSARLESSWLFHLLEWAGSNSFDRASSIRPAFSKYILTARRHGDEILSPVYVSHVVRSAHRFFTWLSKNRRGSVSISAAWLDTLKVPDMTIEPAIHEIVTLDEIRLIASAPVQTIRDRRIRASAVFWWLSGIRIGAFVSLPVVAVHLDTLTIDQFPRLGVRTKFKKHARTFLLDIPDLLEVVKDWHEKITLADSFFWFASVSPETGLIDSSVKTAGFHRDVIARKNLADWLSRVGLPYHSPHKFRHGNAVYSLKHAKDIQALKAVSQNLMHSNLSITDGVYGILSDLDVKAQIQSLGKVSPTAEDDLLKQIRKLLK